MIFVYEAKKVRTKIENNKALKKLLYSMHEDFNIRSSNYDWQGSYIINDEGKKIGKVSYNSRVWNVNNDDEELFFEGNIVVRTEIEED
jgi:hypothetical protein